VCQNHQSIGGRKEHPETVMPATLGMLVLFASSATFRDTPGGTVRAYFAQSDSPPLGFTFANGVTLVVDDWRRTGRLRLSGPEQTPAVPPARAHHALVYDESSHRVLLYGGSTATSSAFTFLDDLWAWRGHRWERVPSRGPARASHRLVYDTSKRRLLMLGGYDGRSSLGDILRFDGTEWSVVWSDTAFVRAELSAVYDSRRQRVVAFGGSRAPGALLGDTWEFDGAHWLRVATTGPGALQASAMVYDEARGVTLLFGGADAARGMHNETWAWNGTEWRRLATTGPSPRMASGIAYDAKRREVVLFGGAGAEFTSIGDTWIWNGEVWRERNVPGPSRRSMGYMAYDRARGVTVLFGGQTMFPDDLADTWEWNGVAWHLVLTP
jgi:hypothetical protein